LLQELLFLGKTNRLADRDNTLVFIDETQQVPHGLWYLRSFYGETPGIPVITAAPKKTN
jgi:hypothetical protein